MWNGTRSLARSLARLVDSCKLFGKISAQPHTIVKQIQWQCIVLVIVFSIQELNA